MSDEKLKKEQTKTKKTKNTEKKKKEEKTEIKQKSTKTRKKKRISNMSISRHTTYVTKLKSMIFFYRMKI